MADANDVLARNVRRFRHERSLSMAELARASGLSKQTVASIEAGGANPTIETVERLSATLRVSIRALMTELGTEVLVERSEEGAWVKHKRLQIRRLDQVFGSGYVTNALLRVEANRGESRHALRGRGSLRHCYVLEGRLSLGPDQFRVIASAGDFVRFPADAEHSFEAITPIATVFVCTTAPQLSMSGPDDAF